LEDWIIRKCCFAERIDLPPRDGGFPAILVIHYMGFVECYFPAQVAMAYY